uniref:M48 family metalloprotease n=1 Tax=Pedobacter schmidteae TaxID=2201271 RepID=UPI000EB21AD8|nr:M48 family metallopeptidase [Pedobacter schmidteae]
MQSNAFSVSENFRKMAIKSMLSIALFLFTYLVLIILAIGVVALCGLIAYAIIMLKAMIITIMLGLGFIGMGFLIFFFLIKFIFSRSAKVDRSHLIEITQSQQPQLFKMINEIVVEVKTDYPKKVYLSSDVNASVFYDSSFWSMFFPVKKNLQIGLGLMNSVSAVELKAILAHEFGHFSQRSMKVGGYVYHVNKVIYNMLYDNDSYSNLLNRWSNMSSYFSLFSGGAIWVIGGIQQVLYKVYNRLNLSYMALSREMEFHADAVAASVAGSQPLISSLLRLGIADQSLSTVFDYYNSKIETSQRTNNIYPQHFFVLNQIANVEKLPFNNGLPSLTVDVYKRFSKTKLILDNQWSSHPSTEERVAGLMMLNQPQREQGMDMAMDLLVDKDTVQEMITDRLFVSVNYADEVTITDDKTFKEEYLKREEEYSYPEIYNGYFISRDPHKEFTLLDLEITEMSEVQSFEVLFSDQMVGLAKTLETAIADLQIIERIKNREVEINTFDYDGKKYSSDEATDLCRNIEDEINRLTEQLKKNEIEIFSFFLNKSIHQGKLNEFRQYASNYLSVADEMQLRHTSYIELANITYFMQTSTPLETIRENMHQVKQIEKPFKEQVGILLTDDLYRDLMREEVRSRFEKYLSNDWQYFNYDTYHNEEVEAFFVVMNDFSWLVFNGYFKMKKALLEFQADLLKE